MADYPCCMKVVLPDGKELELEDGATGLDAARAIGPKLAEQAVLARAGRGDPGPARAARRRPDGAVPDHARRRRPRRALRPAPFERAPARRGGAPALSRASRSRSGRRSRTASTTTSTSPSRSRGRPRDDRGRGEPRDRRGPRLDARGDLARRGPRAASRPRASRTRSSSSTPPRATISLYIQSHDGVADFTDLCRGPHLQDSSPIKAFKLTGPRGRLLARRRERTSS